MLKKFEAFNYVPDKKIIDEEMAKRVPTGSEKMDKEGVFFGIEKQLLEKYGFVIKENTKEYADYTGFGFRNINYRKAKQVAEASDGGFDIIIYKMSPENYNHVNFYYTIIKNKNVIKSEDTATANEYKKVGEEYVSREKEKKIIELFNKLYFSLYDLKEKEGNRKIVDPFGEENWWKE